ncbi:MAG: ThuA domain-containing protein [Microthrixaceae bacterium]
MSATTATAGRPDRMQACLVAGGKYHDIDYARRQLLDLLAEHENLRVTVRDDWEDTSAISAARLVVSYTCDVRPSENAQAGLDSWVRNGGRLLALHGTNSALDVGGPNGVESPRCFEDFANALGSQFIAHPAIEPYTVHNLAPGHWLVAGIEDFETTDELYLMEHAEPSALERLLATNWLGTAEGFVESDWNDGPGERLVQYLRPLGEGAVLYNTLGHCRGHYDMEPLKDWWPTVDRCSWELPQYRELLRRAIRWAMGATS